MNRIIVFLAALVAAVAVTGCDNAPQSDTSGRGLTSFGTDAYGEIYYTRGSGEVRKIVPVTVQGPDCNGNSVRDARAAKPSEPPGLGVAGGRR